MRSNRLRELNKTSKGSKIFISFLIISVILLFGYKFYLDAGRDFGRGVKEASETGSVTIYENSIKEQNNIR